MIIRRLGYACINDELNSRKPKISTSRTMRKATFDKLGLTKVEDLCNKNLNDLFRILKWNKDRGVKLFRMSSDIFPWKSEWNWGFLSNWKKIHTKLGLIGDYARKYDIRLTFHPGPYNKLCSTSDRVVQNTIKDLEAHNDILNFMGFSPSHENSVNIHVGAAYYDKKETAKRFCKNFKDLSPSLKLRLTVENDDGDALYNTQELYDMIHCQIGVPIMFDFHHHRCYPTNYPEVQAVNKAISTWRPDVTPLFHWSESRQKEFNDPTIRVNAHSDYTYGPLPDYSINRPIDLMIEAKKKEKNLNLLKYADSSLVGTFTQAP